MLNTFISRFFRGGIFKKKTHQTPASRVSKKEKPKEKKKAKEKQEAQKIDQGLAVSSLSLGLATAGALVYAPLSVTAIVGLLYLGVPLGKEAYEWLKNEGRTAALLDLLVLAGCLTQGYYVAGSLALASSYFSRKFLLKEEQKAHERAQRFFPLFELAGKASRVAWLLKEDVEIEVPSDSLQAGEVVVVHPGELVPADGTITQGIGLIDQRLLTGNSCAVIKEIGEKVFTGNMVLAGRITVQIESVHDTTCAAQVGSILKQASNDKTTRQLWMASYKPLSQLCVATLASFVVGPMGAIAIMGARSSYDKIAPIEMATFLKEGINRGILIRDGRALEWLSEVNTVVIDHQVAQRPESAAIISQLRERYVESIYLFAHDPRQRRGFGIRQTMIKADHYFRQRSPEDKAKVIAQLQADGAVICYISHKSEPVIQKEAKVSICPLLTSEPGRIDIPSTDIILMDGTLNRLGTLFEMAQNFDAHSKKTFITSLIPSILAVSGPFLFNSGLVTTIVLNNIGLFAALKQAKAPKSVTSNQ